METAELIRAETSRAEEVIKVDFFSVWFVRRLLREMQVRHPGLAFTERKSGWTVFDFSLSGDPNSVAATRRAIDRFYLNRMNDYPLP